jgi:hypothetical protein
MRGVWRIDGWILKSGASGATMLTGNVVVLPYVQILGPTIGTYVGPTGQSAGGPLLLPSLTFRWCDFVTNVSASIFWKREGTGADDGLGIVTATYIGVC